MLQPPFSRAREMFICGGKSFIAICDHFSATSRSVRVVMTACLLQVAARPPPLDRSGGLVSPRAGELVQALGALERAAAARGKTAPAVRFALRGDRPAFFQGLYALTAAMRA